MASFAPENELETLFLDAYANARRRPAFFRRLLEATVYVMDDPQPNDGAATAPGIRLLDIGGVGHVPAFSSISRIHDFGRRDGRYHEVPARALIERFRDRPLILNPGSSPVKVFSREEITALLDGTLLVDY